MQDSLFLPPAFLAFRQLKKKINTMAEAATLNRNTDKPLKLDAAIKKKKTPVTFKGETGEILGFPNAPCSHKILEA